MEYELSRKIAFFTILISLITQLALLVTVPIIIRKANQARLEAEEFGVQFKASLKYRVHLFRFICSSVQIRYGLRSWTKNIQKCNFFHGHADRHCCILVVNVVHYLVQLECKDFQEQMA
jgi:hypothetical protein